MNIGIPKKAIDVGDGTVVGTMVIGAMIHKKNLGSHPLFPLGDKEPPNPRLAWPDSGL